MNVNPTKKLLATSIATILLVSACTQAADGTSGDDSAGGDKTVLKILPEYNEAGELIRPKNFRESWVYLGAPFTPNSLNNGEAGFPEFHNVYTQPGAFHAYRKTGEWPEGTMMLKELQLVDDPEGDHPDGSRNEASGRGFFPGAVNGMDIAVKDSTKFADSRNWGYFNFGHRAPPYEATAAAAPIGECAGCHIANDGVPGGTVDMVYVDFYKPILTPLPDEAQD